MVKEMKQSDFKSFQEVRPHMADRKTNTDGEVSWLKIQSMEWRLRKRLISKTRKEEGTQ